MRDKDWGKISEYYILPHSMKNIDHTKIYFKEKKKTLKHFVFIINGNGTKKSKNQLSLKKPKLKLVLNGASLTETILEERKSF